MADELKRGVCVTSPRPSRNLPALYANGKAPEGVFHEYAFAQIRKHWNEYELREDGTWSFRIDICEEDKVGLLEGDLHDLLAEAFRDLLDLRRFQEATYHLHIPFFDSGVGSSVANVTSLTLTPEIVAMCSALGMEIDVYQPRSGDVETR